MQNQSVGRPLKSAPLAPLPQVMLDFLSDIAAGSRRATVATYRHALRGFASSALYDLSISRALMYGKRVSECYSNKNTVCTHLAALSVFCVWLVEKGIIAPSAAEMATLNATFKKYRRGGGQPLPKLPPDDAITALTDQARGVTVAPRKCKADEARGDLARLRDISLLEALRASGMRIGEAMGLKRGDLDYRQRSARVTGKGNKQRIVYFDAISWDAIQTYLRARRDGSQAAALLDTLPLFARHDRRSGKRILPMNTDRARKIFLALKEDAGIELKMTPHSLRHAFATRILEATSDLAVVQDMLGHSSPVTTRIYAKVSSKRMRDAHAAAFGG